MVVGTSRIGLVMSAAVGYTTTPIVTSKCVNGLIFVVNSENQGIPAVNVKVMSQNQHLY